MELLKNIKPGKLKLIGFSGFFVFSLFACHPKSDKDLSKEINTATTDAILKEYFAMKEALEDLDSIKFDKASKHLSYISIEFPVIDEICRIEQILMQEKSQQEKLSSLTLQIQKILKNSQGNHYLVDSIPSNNIHP